MVCNFQSQGLEDNSNETDQTLIKLEEGKFNEKTLPLINVLFGIFEPTYNNSEETLNLINKLEFINDGLNESQKEAVKFALTVNEVGLIHGPPGTGKTTTIVEIILQLLKLGKKILVVAPSNIAVDNIAEKLIKFRNSDAVEKFDLCRIGHPVKLLANVVDISLDQKVEENSLIKAQKDVKREIEKVKKNLSRLSFKDKEERIELKGQLKGLYNEMKGTHKKAVFDVFQKCKIVLSTCVGSGDNFIDYHDCYKWFTDLVEQYEIYPLKIGYDRYSAQYLIQDLQTYGFHCDDVYQGDNLYPVLMEFEGLLKDKKIHIGNNDLLKIHMLNSAIKFSVERNRGKLVKLSPQDHIDGMASLADAMTVRQKWYGEIGGQLINEE